WMGGPGTLTSSGAGTSLLFGAEGVFVAQSNLNNAALLTAAVSASAPDQLRVTTAGTTTGGCAATDAGTYTWSLSPSGRVLSFSRVDDPCAEREGALTGTW